MKYKIRLVVYEEMDDEEYIIHWCEVGEKESREEAYALLEVLLDKVTIKDL